ncbi:hypothetical protein [Nostoc sp.]|uniref:hypothetical protein n=1 Tax=Nostoc sp. TaxID=1180 RepID=UPI002FFCB2AC
MSHHVLNAYVIAIGAQQSQTFAIATLGEASLFYERLRQQDATRTQIFHFVAYPPGRLTPTQ